MYYRHFKAPFNTEEGKRDISRQLEETFNETVSEDKWNSYPSFDARKLLDDTAYDRFSDVIRGMVDVYKRMKTRFNDLCNQPTNDHAY